MGGYLSEPKTRKRTQFDCNSTLQCISSQMQGWRTTMQDAKLMQIHQPNFSIFGVFDGHGGQEVALFIQKFFLQQLQKNPNFEAGLYKQALQETYMKLDYTLQTPEGKRQLTFLQGRNSVVGENIAGSTAVVALIIQNQLYVANVGDSRCVLAKNGQAFQLSTDHKPTLPDQLQRIQAAGGVVQQGRINGGINLTRSIGDPQYKQNQSFPPEKQMLIAFPQVQIQTLQGADFMILACDGVWEMITNEDCVNFIYEKINQRVPLKRIIESLLDRCLARDVETSGGFGLDNITCIIAKFK